MKYTKCFAGCALAVGLLAAGVPAASAEDWHRQDNRYAYTYNYDRIEDLQRHIARDRAQLNEAIRCGNDAEAGRQAADLARDQRALNDLQRAQNVRYNDAQGRRGGAYFRFGWR